MIAAEFTIPTVDISPYLEDGTSLASQAVIASIAAACKTSGFFQITGHGISPVLQQQVLDGAKTFFNLPLEEKTKLKGMMGRGYDRIGFQSLQPGTKPDLKEGFMAGPEVPDNQPLYRDFQQPNKWPQESVLPSTNFKVPMLEYHKKLGTLSQVIMRILAHDLPASEQDDFSEFCFKPVQTLRILHYPPQIDLEDKMQWGAGAHTDFGALTLLLQDEIGGLQVLNRETGVWVDVPPNKTAYVVNAGGMLTSLTGGRFVSGVHRVLNKSGKHRYSVPFFYNGNLDFAMKPVEGRGEEKVTVEEILRRRYLNTYT